MVSLVASMLACAPAFAADNELTPQEKRDGWLLLFDGRTTNGWMNSDRTAPRMPVADSAHKFDLAWRDHPRRGYIGLQDHGSPCWFKNIQLKPGP